MTYSGHESRKAARRRVLKSGYILLGDKAPKIESVVRNLSDGGVLLRLDSTTLGIPRQFALVIDGVRHTVWAAWKAEVEMGVTFSPPAKPVV